MPNYRRPFAPGGAFFFTLVTQARRRILTSDLARPILRNAIGQTRHERPFDLIALVLFGDHLHLMMELPPGDGDFSVRLSAIKARFTREFLAAGGDEGNSTGSQKMRGGRGVWQTRFYDHLIRDETDLGNHLKYVHYNPVKHGPATHDVRMIIRIRHFRSGFVVVFMSRRGRARAATVWKPPTSRGQMNEIWNEGS